MKKFLEDIAERLITAHPHDMDKIAVVLPGKRAGLFLKRHLADRLKKTFFPPEIITISDLINLLSEDRAAEIPELIFVLYEAYSDLEKGSAESFDQFNKWGGILLGDFNEMDRYCVNASSLFTDLRNIKEIENWSFNESELTTLQKKYLGFWNKLGDLYSKFNQILDDKKIAYQGRMYRRVSENISQNIDKIHYKELWFAGFNALSASEKIIIKALIQNKKAKVFFDADEWYVKDRDHEAGLFFRSVMQQWDNAGFDLMDGFFRKQPKKIEVIGAPGMTAQARVAGELISEMKGKGSPENTALVLGDEKLLLPVLHSLPEEVEKVNITMGYPLRHAHLFQLYNLLFEIHSGKKTGKGKIYFRHLLRILHQPVIRKMIGDEAIKLEKDIVGMNRIMIQESEISKEKHPLFSELLFLFNSWTIIPEDPLSCLEKLNAKVKIFFSHVQYDPFEMEYVFHLSSVVSGLRSIVSSYPYIREKSTLLQLLRQYVNKKDVSFFGEPLEGLQLMGMLETRALDFKRIILLGVNENTIPGQKTEHSFIPFEVKRRYHLPTYVEKDAVFANHFYRLLQRAENIWLVYNTEQDFMGGGEKSRFIQQLENELRIVSPASQITDKIAQFSNRQHNNGNWEPPKSQAAISRMQEWMLGGVSPSALQRFLTCPRDFYYSYIIGLKEIDEVEETVDQSAMGNIIHGVLDELYKPLAGTVLNQRHFDKMISDYEVEIGNQFAKYFKQGDFMHGKNHLVYQVVKKYLEQFFKAEKSRSIEESPVEILYLETKMESLHEFAIHGKKIPVLFTGKSDRIDKSGGITRIIDYKTGKVEENQVKIKSLDEVLKPGKGKAFQLMCYAWLYRESGNDIGKGIKSGIFPLRNFSSGLMTLAIGKTDLITPEMLDEFKDLLEGIFENMLDIKQPFRHELSAKYCRLCVS